MPTARQSPMRTAVAAAAAAVLFSGCAIAGERAAAGAASSLRQAQAETGGDDAAMVVAGRRLVEGATKEVAAPESAALIAAAVNAAVNTAVDEALARVHRELADGDGPLAKDLDATFERAASAAVRGVDRQLDEMLGGCDGLDRRACLRREVRALGREASAGFVQGVGPPSWLSAAVVFLAGATAALLARAAVGHLGGRGGRRPARA